MKVQDDGRVVIGQGVFALGEISDGCAWMTGRIKGRVERDQQPDRSLCRQMTLAGQREVNIRILLLPKLHQIRAPRKCQVGMLRQVAETRVVQSVQDLGYVGFGSSDDMPDSTGSTGSTGSS